MSDSSAKKFPTIENLQILRFVAAFMVLLSHVQHELVVRGGGEGSVFHPFDPVYWPGGVDIFFVISGFIIYFVGHRAFAVGGARDFMLKRLVRIVPMYWIFTTLMLVSVLVLRHRVAHSDLSLSNIIQSYLFIPSRNAYGEVSPVLALGWTLNFEMMFYVVFASGLLMPRRAGMVFIVLVIGALAALSTVDLSRFVALDFWASAIVLEFLFGIGLAGIYLSGLRIDRWTSALFVIASIGAMLLAKKVNADTEYSNLRFVWMGIPAFMLCAGLSLVREQGVASGVGKALVLGGDASYALYLSHPFVINLVGIVWAKIGINSDALYIIVSISAAVLAAILIHVYFERVVSRRLAHMIFRSRQGGNLSKATA